MIGAVIEAEILQFVREIMSVRTGEPLSIGSRPEMDNRNEKAVEEPSWLRGRERQRSMWPVPVVMVREDTEDPLKVRLVQSQQPVETFRADGAHEPFGDAVGLWRAKRRPHDLDSVAARTPRQNAR